MNEGAVNEGAVNKGAVNEGAVKIKGQCLTINTADLI